MTCAKVNNHFTFLYGAIWHSYQGLHIWLMRLNRDRYAGAFPERTYICWFIYVNGAICKIQFYGQVIKKLITQQAFYGYTDKA